MSKPTVSIITPSLNQGSHLDACIQSVLEQDYDGVEHIVIDAASEDSTLEVLRRYPHLRWVSEPDDGQAAAINKGFAMARGDVLAWLNCDDTYRPGTIREVARANAEATEPTVVLGEVQLLHNGNELRVMSNHPRRFSRFLQPWIPNTNISQPGVFIPRAILDQLGPLDESLHYTMDYELLCRVFSQGFPCRRLDRVVADYHLHADCKLGRGWYHMYPELDRIILDYKSHLPATEQLVFELSYRWLRPLIRGVCRVCLPPVY